MSAPGTVPPAPAGETAAAGAAPATFLGRLTQPWRRSASDRLTVSPVRNRRLEVVRGLAVLLVVGAHLELNLPEDGWLHEVGQIWKVKGGFAMPLLLFLAGFWFGGVAFSELRQRRGVAVGRFFLRRGLELLPAYYLFMGYLVAMPILREIAAHNDVGAAVGAVLGNYWASLFFVQNYAGPTMAGHTWILAVLGQCAAVIPLAIAGFIVSKRVSWLAPCCLAAALVSPLVHTLLALLGDPYLVDVSRKMAATHLNVDTLLLGVGCRAWEQFHPAAFARLRPWRFVMVAVGFAGYLAWPRFELLSVPSVRILPVGGLCAAAVVVGAHFMRAGDLRSYFRPVMGIAAAVAWIGTHSYSIFLWHVTLTRVVERAVVRQWGWDVSTAGWWLAAVLVITGTVVAGGVVASLLVERPALYWRDRLLPG